MQRGFSLGLLALLLSTPTLARADDDGWLSRVTIAAPVFTRHIPHDELFNDNNWGGFVFFRVSEEFYLAAGDYTNSYDRNTAFAAVSWLPIKLDGGWLRLDAGGMLGVDLNGGYKNFNSLDPLLGAFNFKFSGHYFDDPGLALFNRLGLLVTVIPGLGANTSTAVNLAVTLRL